MREDDKCTTITVQADASTIALINRFNDHFVSLGKDPIDLNDTINEALASLARDLAWRGATNKDNRQWLNEDGLRKPHVCDIWCERPGFIDLTIVCVLPGDDLIVHTYVSTAGLMPGRYRCTREWLKHMVLYDSSLNNPGAPMLFKSDRFIGDKDGSRYKEFTDPDAIKNEIAYATDIRDRKPGEY